MRKQQLPKKKSITSVLIHAANTVDKHKTENWKINKNKIFLKTGRSSMNKKRRKKRKNFNRQNYIKHKHVYIFKSNSS